MKTKHLIGNLIIEKTEHKGELIKAYFIWNCDFDTLTLAQKLSILDCFNVAEARIHSLLKKKEFMKHIRNITENK